MARGRAGFALEAWKFSVYITIPVFASWYYSYPETQKYWADYYQYIRYPENPNTNVKQKIKELAEQKEKEREQRLAYHKQLEELQKAAERSSNYQKDKEEGEEMLSSLSTAAIPQGDTNQNSTTSPSWWGRWIGGRKQ